MPEQQLNSTTYVDINIDQNGQTEFVGPKKTNFLYDKCYICISIFKWFPVLFISAILIWSYYAYVIQLCLLTIESTAVKGIYIILFNALYFMTLWSYMQTVFTKSSIAPAAFRLTNADYQRIVKETTDERRNQILFEISKERQLPLACRTYSGAVRLCNKCNLIKPDRAHHCSVCNNCVLKMDHHCPWVNNCVSFSNYKFFILFLMYSFLMCLFGAVTSFPYFLEFWSNQLPTLGKFNILFLFFVSIMFSISLFSLFSYHIYLVLRNLTTLENFRSPLFAYGPNKNAFNLGRLNNLKEVFGDNEMLWLIPVYTSLGFGVSFPFTEDHANFLTQRMRQQQEQKVDSNELNEFKDRQSKNTELNNEKNNETDFNIQMPGSTH